MNKKPDNIECHWFSPPPECKNVEWYNSIPYKCINCIDRHIFDLSYVSPNKVVSDPRTGEITHKLSEWNQTIKKAQTVMDFIMEFTQIYLFITVLTFLYIFKIFYFGILGNGMIPNPDTITSDTTSEIINYANGIFPRLVFAIIFSYFVEGLIKHTFFRHRPNMVQGAVSDGDRFMGINDLYENDESYEMWNRSKGHTTGIKSHRSSFPSGHNTGAWTLFAIIFFTGFYTGLDNKKSKIGNGLKIAMGVSLILCFYQVYARVSLGGWHWGTDILAGIILGFLSAFFGGIIYKVLKKNGAGAKIFTTICFFGSYAVMMVGSILSMMFSEEILFHQSLENMSLFSTPKDNILRTIQSNDLITSKGQNIIAQNKGWTRMISPASTTVRNQDVVIDALGFRDISIDCDAGFGDSSTSGRKWTPATGYGKYGIMEPGMYNINQRSFYENAKQQCLPENQRDKLKEFIDSLQIFDVSEYGGDNPILQNEYVKQIYPYLPLFILFAVYKLFQFLWKLAYNAQQRKIVKTPTKIRVARKKRRKHR